jgi:putative flavoprotein involved in K+ transport
VSRRIASDSVVIGAGPAGLAASAALTKRGIEHLLLERGRVGQTWRAQRWDSLRLNNPGWMNPMLGEQPPGTYLTALEVVARLARLALVLPVREETTVSSVRPYRDRWKVEAGAEEIVARTVVVATGNENRGRTPALARLLPGRVFACHAAEYRSPARLPDGAVLIIGSAQSGYQIAEELLAADRRVIVATSRVGRAPARHRGRETVEWLVESGFFDQRTADLADPSVICSAQPLLAPGGRSASLQALASRGATLLGRLVRIDGNQLTFDDSVPANIAAADAFAARIRAMLDEYIARTGGPLPPIESDEADRPVRIDVPTSIDIRAEHIGSVVWCTGYTGDFSWLDPILVDETGQPRHFEAAAPIPGLWYVGLRWLMRRGSGNFIGFPTDADAVAAAVATRLGAAPTGGGRRSASAVTAGRHSAVY